MDTSALDRQNAEFDALSELARAWSVLQRIAVVDDDYPKYRHIYESALKAFLSACATNARYLGLSFDRLRAVNIQRCLYGFGHTLDSWSVAEWGNATAGECGEACNIAKKILRFQDGIAGNKKSKEEYIVDLATEIAGTLIYLDLWAASQGIDLGDAVVKEFNKKSVEIASDIRL